MPKNCKSCRFACKHYEYGEYYSYCELDETAIYKLHERLRNLLPINGKSKNCPLLEIEIKYKAENEDKE